MLVGRHHVASYVSSSEPVHSDPVSMSCFWSLRIALGKDILQKPLSSQHHKWSWVSYQLEMWDTL